MSTNPSRAGSLAEWVNDYSSERPPVPIVAPAVTRNMMFRLEAEKNPRWKVDDEQRKPLWCDLCTALEYHVNGLRTLFGSTGPTIEFRSRRGTDAEHRVSGSIIHYLNQSCIITVHNDRRFRLRIRVDLYQEFCSVGLLFDKISKAMLASFGLDKFETVRNPARANKAFDHIFKAKNLKKLAKNPRSKMAILAALPETGRATLNNGREGPILGRMQGDFRGIILQNSSNSQSLGQSSFLPINAAQAAVQLSSWLNSYCTANETMLRAVAAPSESSSDETKGGEAIVCGMLNGSALYAAELGKWGEPESMRQSVPPVRHLIVYNGSSAAQLGRLERRLHVLGELRHAALLDYDNVGGDSDPRKATSDGSDNAISSASRRIRNLGKYVDYTTSKYTDPVTGRLDLDIGKLNRFVTELGVTTHELTGILSIICVS
jgi:hypothetical protein